LNFFSLLHALNSCCTTKLFVSTAHFVTKERDKVRINGRKKRLGGSKKDRMRRTGSRQKRKNERGKERKASKIK
jgi:hypothetical protein